MVCQPWLSIKSRFPNLDNSQIAAMILQEGDDVTVYGSNRRNVDVVVDSIRNLQKKFGEDYMQAIIMLTISGQTNKRKRMK